MDNAIRKAGAEHKTIVEPLAKAMKETYVFIPEDMYEAYVRKIDEGKRGDFLTCIKTFLENLGLECKQGQISKFAETMSDKFGARYATSKKIVNDGTLTTHATKNNFRKLFMAVFCDMYIKQNDHSDNAIYVEWCKNNEYEVCAGSWKLFEAMVDLM